MNKNNCLCNNCGKQGHQFHQCKLSITSYGIILFRSGPIGLQFLMLRRKDSFGFIDFVRGKYSPNNIEHIQSIIDEMSIGEKYRLLSDTFNDLWKNMWGEMSSIQYRSEETASSNKFELLKNGIIVQSDKKIERKLLSSVNEKCKSLEHNAGLLCDIVKKSKTNWKETEWEFPKGRRNFNEKDLDCALREFEEETGISRISISIIQNILPFEEIFIGTNHKSYKHKYFLANSDELNNNLENFQRTEVSKLEWKTYDECMSSIRPYNLEKKKIITNVNNLLQEYRLYS